MTVDRTLPPIISHFSKLHIPTPEITVLDNGVSIMHVNTGQGEANSISVCWKYGPRYCGGNVAPSLVPSMLMQGTSRYSAEQIVDRIDFLGAFLNKIRLTGYTVFDALSLNEFTTELLDIVHDILTDSTFPSERFEALLRNELANFDLALSQTSVVASRKLNSLLAGQLHPYLKYRTRQDIENVTIDEVRDAWRKGVFESKLTILASGRLSSSVLERIQSFAYNLRPSSTIVAPEAPPVRWQPEAAKIYRIPKPDAQQASIAMAIPTIGREHPDYPDLAVAVTALGGYFGSRLNSVIREQMGLTYGISARLESYPEGSAIFISADCDASYVDRVLEQTNIEMNRMSQTTMDSDEFNRLLAFSSTTLASVLESFVSVARYWRSTITSNVDPEWFNRRQQALARLTPERLQYISQTYFNPDSAITVVVGPES